MKGLRNADKGQTIFGSKIKKNGEIRTKKFRATPTFWVPEMFCWTANSLISGPAPIDSSSNLDLWASQTNPSSRLRVIKDFHIWVGFRIWEIWARWNLVLKNEKMLRLSWNFDHRLIKVCRLRICYYFFDWDKGLGHAHFFGPKFRNGPIELKFSPVIRF